MVSGDRRAGGNAQRDDVGPGRRPPGSGVAAQWPQRRRARQHASRHHRREASQEMANTRGGPTMIVHGASRGQNNFTLNGSNFTNYSQTAGFNPPPPDAVQEIRVQTSTFSAEFGNNAGAQVSMVTKAGSNQFHGSAWEFHRNDTLNARSFFQPRQSRAAPESVWRVGWRPYSCRTSCSISAPTRS